MGSYYVGNAPWFSCLSLSTNSRENSRKLLSLKLLSQSFILLQKTEKRIATEDWVTRILTLWWIKVRSEEFLSPNCWPEWSASDACFTPTWIQGLILKEEAGLLGLAHQVVSPQRRLRVMHHLGGHGWVVRRHSVHVALLILLQQKYYL